MNIVIIIGIGGVDYIVIARKIGDVVLVVSHAMRVVSSHGGSEGICPI
jgi:hypothetical protein